MNVTKQSAAKALEDKQKAIDSANASAAQRRRAGVPMQEAPAGRGRVASVDASGKTTSVKGRDLSAVPGAELERRANAAKPTLPDAATPEDYLRHHQAREARAEIMKRALKAKPTRL